MKKAHLFLFCLFLLSLSFVHAQRSTRRMEYGIKAGSNIAVLTDANYRFQEVNFSPGYQVGVYGRINSRLLQFQIEALYATKDWKTVEAATIDGAQSQILFSRELKNSNAYITIPMMAYIPLGKRFSLGIGPQVDALVKAVAEGQQIYTEVKSGNKTVTEVAWDYIKDEIGQKGGAYEQFGNITKDGNFYNALGLGTNLGVSLNLKRTRLEGRLNYTLTDVVNDYYGRLIGGQEAKEKVISGQVLLCIKL